MSINYKKPHNNKLPNIVDTLLKLDNNQIELLSDTLLFNLTNEQLRLIETSPNVNYKLILRLRYVDQKNFAKDSSSINRHEYWRKIKKI